MPADEVEWACDCSDDGEMETGDEDEFWGDAKLDEKDEGVGELESEMVTESLNDEMTEGVREGGEEADFVDDEEGDGRVLALGAAAVAAVARPSPAAPAAVFDAMDMMVDVMLGVSIMSDGEDDFGVLLLLVLLLLLVVVPNCWFAVAVVEADPFPWLARLSLTAEAPNELVLVDSTWCGSMGEEEEWASVEEEEVPELRLGLKSLPRISSLYSDEDEDDAPSAAAPDAVLLDLLAANSTLDSTTVDLAFELSCCGIVELLLLLLFVSPNCDRVIDILGGGNNSVLDSVRDCSMLN